MKKLISLVLALAMVLLCVGAYASTFTGTAEDEIVALGLASGDTVSVYQVVEWDVTTDNWKLTTLGEAAFTNVAAILNGISAEEANNIANAASGSGTAMTWDSENSRFHLKPVNPGMYYIKAVPADPDTVYNPAFVSADYYDGSASVTFSTEIGNGAYIKKSTIDFDKEVDSTTDTFVDVKPGDVIPYKITTSIPSFGTNFTNPIFKIEDTLSEGLELEGTISVKYGSITTTATNDDVTITPKADKSGYTVEFKKDYLQGRSAESPAVEITYSAKVTTAAMNNVTYMDNKAKLTFSHTPEETKDKEDITRHYTFSIDGDILGKTETEGSELIKTGKNADGTYITEKRRTFHETEVGVLEGASFKLEGVAGTGTAGVSKTVNSDGNGRIKFTGLDAGTYKLTETSAPTGYIRDLREFTVVITPTYSTDPATPDLLVSYEISIRADGYIGGATFSMTNNGGVTVESTIESATNLIDNTQGTELPSTGGIGTTIFYVVGGMLLVGAAIVLVARRKASEN